MVYAPTYLNTINTVVNTMVKKLKQGQKYQEGFTQKHILLKLCEKDRTPTTEILDFLKDEFGIREPKNVRIHLKKLENGKLIKKDSTGVGHVDYWSVISDFKVLIELVGRFKYDPDSQHDFMESPYYRNCAPKLVSWFAISFAELKLSVFDIHNEESISHEIVEGKRAILDLLKRHSPDDYKAVLESEKERMKPTTFTDPELDHITDALTFNWSMLRFVVYFLTADDGTKRELMLKVARDAASTDADAKPNSALLGMVRVANQSLQKYDDVIRGEYLCRVCDGVERTLASKGEPPRMWFTDMFGQIENMRNRYPFLFD